MASIVQVCDYGGPYPGNFIPSLLAVADATRERLGLDSTLVFAAPARDRDWVELIRARGYEPQFIADPRTLRGDTAALMQIARRADARLLQSHFTRFEVPTGLVGRRLGARVVWTVHVEAWNDPWFRTVRRVAKVRLLGGPLCDRVIAVSDAIGRQNRADGYRAERVSVVLNGIDMARFAQLPDRQAGRAALGLAPDERVVLGFCWDPERKGADLIVTACAQIGATALLVGGSELRAALGALPDHVRVIDPVADPGGLFAAADVFCSASRAEGLPYAVGEAMAAGLPVACSRIPGPAPYFAAPGLETFASGDAGALAAVLADLLDPDRRAARGEANRAYVSETLSLERHVQRTLEILELELAAGGAAGGGGIAREATPRAG